MAMKMEQRHAMICDLYKKGRKVSDIALIIGCNQNTIYYVLKKYNITLRTVTRREERQKIENWVCNLFDKGNDLTEICYVTNLYRDDVIRILRENRLKEYIIYRKKQKEKEKEEARIASKRAINAVLKGDKELDLARRKYEVDEEYGDRNLEDIEENLKQNVEKVEGTYYIDDVIYTEETLEDEDIIKAITEANKEALESINNIDKFNEVKSIHNIYDDLYDDSLNSLYNRDKAKKIREAAELMAEGYTENEVMKICKITVSELYSITGGTGKKAITDKAIKKRMPMVFND